MKKFILLFMILCTLCLSENVKAAKTKNKNNYQLTKEENYAYEKFKKYGFNSLNYQEAEAYNRAMTKLTTLAFSSMSNEFETLFNSEDWGKIPQKLSKQYNGEAKGNEKGITLPLTKGEIYYLFNNNEFQNLYKGIINEISKIKHPTFGTLSNFLDVMVEEADSLETYIDINTENGIDDPHIVITLAYKRNKKDIIIVLPFILLPTENYKKTFLKYIEGTMYVKSFWNTDTYLISSISKNPFN